METISRRAWLQRFAASLGLLLCMAAATQARSPTLSIVLTGQSLLRWGLPTAAPTITSLLKGDAAFTNFEATVFDPRKGQSPTDGAVVSPEALQSLKTFGFNLLSLPNNHSWDFKALGIENTLEHTSVWSWFMPGSAKRSRKLLRPVTCILPKALWLSWLWHRVLLPTEHRPPQPGRV